MTTSPAVPPFAALYPFASRWHEIDGHRLHYLDEGRGEPVVMLHGNPTWSFFYRRLIAALSPTHRVIAPDHMGCGLSEKPRAYLYSLATHIRNLESLLETIDGAVTLVLHDWGGAIGMGWAVRHPERVCRIIVLNTAAFLSPRIPLRIAICRTPVLGALLVRGLNAFVRAALTMAVAKHDRMTPEVRAGYLHPYDSWAHRVAVYRFVRDIPMCLSDPSRAVLQAIEDGLSLFRETPILIQWGGRDWCFDRAFLAEWRRRFPQAEWDLYDDAGHWVLEDAHERILPRVRAFLQTSPGEKTAPARPPCISGTPCP